MAVETSITVPGLMIDNTPDKDSLMRSVVKGHVATFVGVLNRHTAEIARPYHVEVVIRVVEDKAEEPAVVKAMRRRRK